MAVSCSVRLLLMITSLISFLTFIAGFVASIPLKLLQTKMDVCPLYIEGKWSESLFVFSSLSSKSCYYSIYLPVVSCIIIGLASFVYVSYTAFFKISDEVFIFPYIVVSAVAAFLHFVAACMISVGWKKSCNNMLKGFPLKSLCDKCWCVFDTIVWKTKSTTTPKATYWLTLSVVSSWIIVLLWSLLLLVSLVRLKKKRSSVMERRSTSAIDPSLQG
ncbi:Uncharacterised protein g3821 [Pycnogonum litorale]